MSISALLIAIFYQPFLNALILIYVALNMVFAHVDMGIAVICFTVLVRLLLLPLTIASSESIDDRLQAEKDFVEIKRRYAEEPIKYQQAQKKLIKEHEGTLRFEFINLLIQLFIALILWRIFSYGLEGKDLHLIYSWLPEVPLPFDLTFLNTIDLTKPHFTMNIITCVLIFLLETLNITFSPLPASRNERILQFTLPIIVYFYLVRMPTGKNLFLITTLIISVLIVLGKEISLVMTLIRRSRGD